RLSDAFRRRAVDKRYLALVVAQTPPPAAATLTHHLVEHDGHVRVSDASDARAKDARLSYRCLAQSPATAGHAAHALLEIRLETGRKHQIRVQLAAAGLALLGDPRYGARS